MWRLVSLVPCVVVMVIQCGMLIADGIAGPDAAGFLATRLAQTSAAGFIFAVISGLVCQGRFHRWVVVGLGGIPLGLLLMELMGLSMALDWRSARWLAAPFAMFALPYAGWWIGRTLENCRNPKPPLCKAPHAGLAHHPGPHPEAQDDQ